MVEDRLSDGTRIAQLLASEIEGDAGPLASLSVTDADPEVEPTVDGALAYRVVREPGADGVDVEAEGVVDDEAEGVADVEAEGVADVYVQPDRARIEFVAAPDAVADAADQAGLRVRPKAVRPPRTLVFVEDGAQVKWARDVFERASDEIGEI